MANPTQIQQFDITDGTDATEGFVNALIFGHSGVGKTALATALPWGTSRWGDTAAYVAWDAGSDSLSSVRESDREHLKVITPKIEMTHNGEKLALNPYKTAMDIASADFTKVLPGCRTLIWDGATRLAEQFLRAVGNTGATVSAKKKEEGIETRLVIGEKGSPEFFAQPTESDYGMAGNMIMQWLELLLQQPMNIIIICVADTVEVEGETIGGPMFVGRKVIPKVAKQVDNMFRISIEGETINEALPGQPPKFKRVNKRFLWTEPQGIWQAKIRKPADIPNTLARVELTTNGTEFWNRFDASGIGIADGTK